MFDKILIANRGEIAVRIMQTAKRMGIATVAIYSEADTNSLHVREADEAVYVGPSPSSQSYLVIENIIAAAKKVGADAIHPGYGFLSENAQFAKAVADSGITFIGPSSDVISKMGDKIESKKIADKAGVNTIPGTTKAITTAEEAVKIAKKLGFPVMIKAAAGGGGKGMRVARTVKEVLDGFKTATNEASASFRDDRVFIEKFIERPRHIEIQILADKHGNTIFLGERECSIQRRNQKVIEEAPSPFLDEKTRQKMGKQAVALAKKVGYSSAGTVEFIVDENKEFYFLEMNTRLQVEHRVTELITGLDLVEQMIRIAAGQRLDMKQSDVKYDGWAFEARIYAEDPSRGFLPSTGRISRFLRPKSSEKIVLDTAVYEGGEVSMFYDPMIAKICTHSATREKAIDAMHEALSSMMIKGISHNVSFLEAIIGHERFRSGDINTAFIAEVFPDGFAGVELTRKVEETLIATAVYLYLNEATRDDTVAGQLEGRSRALNTRWVVLIGDKNHAVSVNKVGDRGYDILTDQGLITVRSSWEPSPRPFQGVVNGRSVSVHVQPLSEGYNLTAAGTTVRCIVRSPRIAELSIHLPDRQIENIQPELLAPIAGVIVELRVKKGDKVHPGQELLVIEAMKMENIIYASHATKIESISCKAGDSVQLGQVLLKFK